uniref:Coiled-coil domain containing 85B n=2 Tax=Erpetoichthys calabaricus TaxID=27687 RepID=A0A8C4RPA3_ERPCA
MLRLTGSVLNGGEYIERCSQPSTITTEATMGSDSEIFNRELSKMSDEDLLACTKEDLVMRLRKEESDKIAALIQRGRLIKEVNKQLQEHLLEIRELKLVNQRLQEENQELRDLCCFLDDDRLKVKKLSREWQLFGHHAAKVMREDLGGYIKKLSELERLQEGLVKENLDLKELCLVLEEECVSRTDSSPAGSSELNLPCMARDLGDGSSSTGSVGSPDQLHLVCSPDD